MEATKTTTPDRRFGEATSDKIDSEWNAAALRPVAHWVQMPTTGGRSVLSMVWEVPDPMPPSLLA